MSTLTAMMFLAGALIGCAPAAKAPPAVTEVAGASDIEIGRYLVKVGGCNDCHTGGFLQAEGKTPESEWLKGSPVGFRGPWGVTYASNLRLTAQNLSEDDWVGMLGSRTGAPPMPWPVTHAMTDANKRSLHRYIRSLGAPGPAAPFALPPGQPPETPYIEMTPVMPSEGCAVGSNGAQRRSFPCS